MEIKIKISATKGDACVVVPSVGILGWSWRTSTAKPKNEVMGRIMATSNFWRDAVHQITVSG